MQAVPYVRAAISQAPTAVHRLQRLCDAVPQAWLHNQGQTQALREVSLAVSRQLDRRKLSSEVCVLCCSCMLQYALRAQEQTNSVARAT